MQNGAEYAPKCPPGTRANSAHLAIEPVFPHCFQYKTNSQNQLAMPAMIGKNAPGFKAQAVVDGEVKEVSLDDYLNKGKYVVLFFYPLDFTFV